MQLLTDKWIPARSGEWLTLEEAKNIDLDAIFVTRPATLTSIILWAVALNQTGIDISPVYGKEERFLQNKICIDKSQRPIEQLFIGTQTTSGAKDNKPVLLQKYDQLCNKCANLGLMEHVLFSLAGGRGHYPGKHVYPIAFWIKRKTFGETIAANTLDGVSLENWYTPNNHYWLCEPVETGTCCLCKKIKPLIKDFWFFGNNTNNITSQFSAISLKGELKPISIHEGTTNATIVDCCSPYSDNAKMPEVIKRNYQEGDLIHAFGYHSDKAKLLNIIDFSFIQRKKINTNIINKTSYFAMQFLIEWGHGKTDSGEAKLVRDEISQRVLGGMNEKLAALAVYNKRYTPSPDYGIDKFKRFIKTRKIISKFATVVEMQNEPEHEEVLMPNESKSLKDSEVAVKKIVAWWHQKINNNASIKNKLALRKCTAPINAIALESVRNLYVDLKETGYDLHENASQLALIAICFANIDEHVKQTAPHLMGKKLKGEDYHKLTENKFDNIIRTEDFDELIKILPMALSKIGNIANVYTLAYDLLHWNHDVRTKWAFEYVGNFENKDID